MRLFLMKLFGLDKELEDRKATLFRRFEHEYETKLKEGIRFGLESYEEEIKRLRKEHSDMLNTLYKRDQELINCTQTFKTLEQTLSVFIKGKL